MKMMVMVSGMVERILGKMLFYHHMIFGKSKLDFIEKAGIKMLQKCNCCDGIYNSIDVHFTKDCDNRCKHCIDTRYCGVSTRKPNVKEIANTIISNQDGFDDVLFLGGEPCLYLDELIECVKMIKQNTKLKVFTTTAVPKICFDRRNKFIELIDLLDGINLSTQHYDEIIADKIRQTKSKYDRQKFYSELSYKNKIRINLNIVKPYLYTKEDLVKCILHYDKMGFNSIKLSEIQHGEDYFISFEKLFNVDYKSPYSYGCQKYIDTRVIGDVKTPILLKRSCFICEESLKATEEDLRKLLNKIDIKPNNKYAVVYEDGRIEKGWI
jgi:organic radical activating enzyme